MSTVEPIRKKYDLKKIESVLFKQNSRDLLIFILGTNCGLRISDILNLNVKDVKDKVFIEITEQKTGKFKKFPINSKLKPILDDFTKDKFLDEPLFKTRFDNRMDRYYAYHMLKDACKKARIHEKIGTHTLRKTFGYHHYKRFKDVAMLQKMFNHSSPEITLRYIGINQEQMEKSYASFVL